MNKKELELAWSKISNSINNYLEKRSEWGSFLNLHGEVTKLIQSVWNDGYTTGLDANKELAGKVDNEMKHNPSSYLDTTIEFNGKKLTLIWDGYELYVAAQFNSRASINSLNDIQNSSDGNATIKFG